MFFWCITDLQVGYDGQTCRCTGAMLRHLVRSGARIRGSACFEAATRGYMRFAGNFLRRTVMQEGRV